MKTSYKLNGKFVDLVDGKLATNRRVPNFKAVSTEFDELIVNQLKNRFSGKINRT